ncbi:FAD-dependent oxidoreductase [Pedobacter sp. BS3]|uniref:FAD-dependent oxidoreductase n=1 Tax=Pedobacter sp. BS3 TaxID=2567937 RepID=UPI0011EEFF46|nr:FAD-dependent oxidoreductase [Pedobacter sp. BS3]TZF84015.1 FAD-dependent oxidoreductase [Pedobacter sp. BS3]
METPRRDFLKAVGLGSGALLLNPFDVLGETEKKEINAIQEKEVFVKRAITADVLIAGGGLAGVCAALAAARNGSKVVLFQNRSRLGGNASSEIRMHICGATQLKQIWRETGIIEELMLTESVTNPQACYEMLDYVFYDKIANEPNITLLLDTMLFSVETSNDHITLAKGYCSQTEEFYEVNAKFYIDCTGDGTLAALAGAEFMRGREAKSTWNEPLGLPKADDITMGNSLLFMAQKHDKPMPFKAPSWARKYTLTDFRYRKIQSWEYGYWWLELGGTENIVNDGQKIRHDLMSVLFGVWDYIKNSGNHPESENWALSWFGLIPGKRESRRITGDYVMIQQDVQNPRLFEDRIAYGGWPLDDHLPKGMDDTSMNPYRSIKLKGPYSIPFRSIYSKSFKNLLMAGRNISVSHVALSSTRVMATCATLGQAAGTAAAFCISKNSSPAQVYANKELLNAYQQLLLRQDQALLGVVNSDPADLARQAKVSTSVETAEGKAVSVIDGYNRNVGDGSTHQWQAPLNGSEQWIALKWPKPQQINTVEFTFDTGLNRFLRISAEASVMKKQVRGPQPETVADYKLVLSYKGKPVYTQQVTDNYLRKKIHTFTGVKADEVKVVISKTNGDALARIFEIRCYG